MEELLYTYGRDEALETCDPAHLRNTEKGTYALKYVDMPRAIEMMRKYRKKKGLGNKVEISLKKEIVLRKTETMQKTIRTLTCPFTRATFGKFRGMNPNGNTPMWSVIEMGPLREFNLDSDDDAADWCILRLAPFIEGSVNAYKYHDTKFWQFNDVRANNANNIFKANDLVKIVNIVNAMGGAEMVNMARLLNMEIGPGDETTLSIIDIKGYLLEIAMTNAEAFMAKYKNVNRSLHEMIYAAMSLGTIQYSHTEGYTMMGNSIGLTIEDVTGYLRGDKNLMGILKNDIVSNDILASRMEAATATLATKQQDIVDSLADSKKIAVNEEIE